MKRILIKLSGEALSGEGGFGFNFEKINYYAKELIKIAQKNIQIVVVVGAGNIWRYSDNQTLSMKRTVSDNLGMTATILNAVTLSQSIEQLGTPTTVFTPATHTISPLATPYTIFNAIEKLKKHHIVFCAGGTGAPFFTTDSAAALRAAELECDCILKGTKVDGIYDADPKKFPDAKKYNTLSYQEAIEKKLKIMDQSAFAICQESNVKIHVFDMQKENAFLTAALGETGFGTIVQKTIS